MTTPIPSLLIRSALATKTGRHAQGAIRYNLLADADRSELFFALVENQGGSGCYSKEAVIFTNIQRCLSGVSRDKPFPSKIFKRAFLVGRGQNNPGYLAACLRHEKLLQAPGDACHGHLVSGDWDAWRVAALAETAEPLPTAVVTSSTISRTEEVGDRGPKPRRSSSGRRHHPTAEAGDADPA